MEADGGVSLPLGSRMDSVVDLRRALLKSEDEKHELTRMVERKQKTIHLLRETLHREAIFLRTQLHNRENSKSIDDAAQVSFFDIFDFLDDDEDSSQHVIERVYREFDAKVRHLNQVHQKALTEQEQRANTKLTMALERMDFFEKIMCTRTTTALEEAWSQVTLIKNDLLTSKAALRYALKDVKDLERNVGEKHMRIQELCDRVRFLEAQLEINNKQALIVQSLAQQAHLERKEEQERQSAVKAKIAIEKSATEKDEDHVGKLCDIPTKASRKASIVPQGPTLPVDATSSPSTEVPLLQIGKYSDEFLGMEKKVFQLEKEAQNHRFENRDKTAAIERLQRQILNQQQELVVFPPSRKVSVEVSTREIPTPKPATPPPPPINEEITHYRARYEEMWREKESALEEVQILRGQLEAVVLGQKVFRGTTNACTQCETPILNDTHERADTPTLMRSRPRTPSGHQAMERHAVPPLEVEALGRTAPQPSKDSEPLASTSRNPTKKNISAVQPPAPSSGNRHQQQQEEIAKQKAAQEKKIAEEKAARQRVAEEKRIAEEKEAAQKTKLQKAAPKTKTTKKPRGRVIERAVHTPTVPQEDDANRDEEDLTIPQTPGTVPLAVDNSQQASSAFVGPMRLLVAFKREAPLPSSKEDLLALTEKFCGSLVVEDTSHYLAVFFTTQTGFSFVTELKDMPGVAAVAIHDCEAHNFCDVNLPRVAALLAQTNSRNPVLMCVQDVPSHFKKSNATKPCSALCCCGRTVSSMPLPTAKPMMVDAPKASDLPWYVPREDPWVHWWAWENCYCLCIVCPKHEIAVPLVNLSTLVLRRDSHEILTVHSSLVQALDLLQKVLQQDCKNEIVAVLVDNREELYWSTREGSLQVWNETMLQMRGVVTRMSHFGVMFSPSLMTRVARAFPTWSCTPAEDFSQLFFLASPVGPESTFQLYIPHDNWAWFDPTPPFAPHQEIFVVTARVSPQASTEEFVQNMSSLIAQGLCQALGGSILDGDHVYCFASPGAALSFSIYFSDCFHRIQWPEERVFGEAGLESFSKPTIALLCGVVQLTSSSVTYHSSSCRYSLHNAQTVDLAECLAMVPDGVLAGDSSFALKAQPLLQQGASIENPKNVFKYTGLRDLLPTLNVSSGKIISTPCPEYTEYHASELKKQIPGSEPTPLPRTLTYAHLTTPPVINVTLAVVDTTRLVNAYGVLPLAVGHDGIVMLTTNSAVCIAFSTIDQAIQFAERCINEWRGDVRVGVHYVARPNLRGVLEGEADIFRLHYSGWLVTGTYLLSHAAAAFGQYCVSEDALRSGSGQSSPHAIHGSIEVEMGRFLSYAKYSTCGIVKHEGSTETRDMVTAQTLWKVLGQEEADTDKVSLSEWPPFHIGKGHSCFKHRTRCDQTEVLPLMAMLSKKGALIQHIESVPSSDSISVVYLSPFAEDPTNDKNNNNTFVGQVESCFMRVAGNYVEGFRYELIEDMIVFPSGSVYTLGITLLAYEAAEDQHDGAFSVFQMILLSVATSCDGFVFCCDRGSGSAMVAFHTYHIALKFTQELQKHLSTAPPRVSKKPIQVAFSLLVESLYFERRGNMWGYSASKVRCLEVAKLVRDAFGIAIEGKVWRSLEGDIMALYQDINQPPVTVLGRRLELVCVVPKEKYSFDCHMSLRTPIEANFLPLHVTHNDLWSHREYSMAVAVTTDSTTSPRVRYLAGVLGGFDVYIGDRQTLSPVVSLFDRESEVKGYLEQIRTFAPGAAVAVACAGSQPRGIHLDWDINFDRPLFYGATIATALWLCGACPHGSALFHLPGPDLIECLQLSMMVEWPGVHQQTEKIFVLGVAPPVQKWTSLSFPWVRCVAPIDEINTVGTILIAETALSLISMTRVARAANAFSMAHAHGLSVIGSFDTKSIVDVVRALIEEDAITRYSMCEGPVGITLTEHGRVALIGEVFEKAKYLLTLVDEKQGLWAADVVGMGFNLRPVALPEYGKAHLHVFGSSHTIAHTPIFRIHRHILYPPLHSFVPSAGMACVVLVEVDLLLPPYVWTLLHLAHTPHGSFVSYTTHDVQKCIHILFVFNLAEPKVAMHFAQKAVASGASFGLRPKVALTAGACDLVAMEGTGVVGPSGSVVDMATSVLSTDSSKVAPILVHVESFAETILHDWRKVSNVALIAKAWDDTRDPLHQPKEKPSLDEGWSMVSVKIDGVDVLHGNILSHTISLALRELYVLCERYRGVVTRDGLMSFFVWLQNTSSVHAFVQALSHSFQCQPWKPEAMAAFHTTLYNGQDTGGSQCACGVFSLGNSTTQGPRILTAVKGPDHAVKPWLVQPKPHFVPTALPDLRPSGDSAIKEIADTLHHERPNVSLRVALNTNTQSGAPHSIETTQQHMQSVVTEFYEVIGSVVDNTSDNNTRETLRGFHKRLKEAGVRANYATALMKGLSKVAEKSQAQKIKSNEPVQKVDRRERQRMQQPQLPQMVNSNQRARHHLQQGKLKEPVQKVDPETQRMLHENSQVPQTDNLHQRARLLKESVQKVDHGETGIRLPESERQGPQVLENVDITAPSSLRMEGQTACSLDGYSSEVALPVDDEDTTEIREVQMLYQQLRSLHRKINTVAVYQLERWEEKEKSKAGHTPTRYTPRPPSGACGEGSFTLMPLPCGAFSTGKRTPLLKGSGDFKECFAAHAMAIRKRDSAPEQ